MIIQTIIKEVIKVGDFDKCVIKSEKDYYLAEGFVQDFETTNKVTIEGDFDLTRSQRVQIYIYNRVKGECVYKATVADIKTNVVSFKDVSFIRSTQKRDNTRVNKQMRYRITHKFVDGNKFERLEKPIDITIHNISANGMLISCRQEFEIGHRFPLVFKDAGRPIDLDVQIVRAEQKRNTYYYGCQFLNISEKDADNIYRFVLHEQIMQRRRNLLL